MKAKNLFIFGLAAALLSGCGGPKKYSKEVTDKDAFADAVAKALTESGMMQQSDAPFYSFVYESSSESKTEAKSMKDGKTLANGSQSSESSREARYDSVNGFLSDKKSSESKSEGENGHGNSVEDYEYFYQADSANGYKIDKHVKSYQKKETTKGKEFVEGEAVDITYDLYSIKNQMSNWLSNKYSKAYIDDTVYTIVIDKNETTEGTAVKEFDIYQIEITKEKLEFYQEKSLESKALNSELKETSKKSMKLTKKDVSLKALDLNDYLLNTQPLY